ncbi:hypothetical protein EV1_024658 [Malus domestica]
MRGPEVGQGQTRNLSSSVLGSSRSTNHKPSIQAVHTPDWAPEITYTPVLAHGGTCTLNYAHGQVYIHGWGHASIINIGSLLGKTFIRG